MPVFPDPTIMHPLQGQDRVVFLRPLIRSDRISVGEFTYYDDPDDPTAFERKNVLYAYGPERLIIGRYCALAAGVLFILSGANHKMDGPSTFPFAIFGGEWTERTLDLMQDLPSRGDTVVGNDVWIGHGATVMPGVSIGDGAIVGAGSMVAKDVPPYGIVAGNPARLLRRRFDDAGVGRLLKAAWWDWPAELVTRHVRDITAGTPRRLKDIARHAGLLDR
jgi:virginiamycin A acetyltransferase